MPGMLHIPLQEAGSSHEALVISVSVLSPVALPLGNPVALQERRQARQLEPGHTRIRGSAAAALSSTAPAPASPSAFSFLAPSGAPAVSVSLTPSVLIAVKT